jgi:aminoglycoside phosphotransferase (APT) family kinase protein
MAEPDVAPRLLASGRDGDIFEHGPGLVLRRTKSGRSIEREARTIRYVAEHGYPVPVVHEVRAGGSEIVMERVDGPVMMDLMLRRPWLIGRCTRMLADLHDALHRIPAPDWLPDLGGDRLLHLDLHPLNVMLSARGPVVIDWTNAAAGEPLLDVAVTYVLLTCPDMPGPRPLQIAVQPVRRALGRTFVRRYRGPAYDAVLAEATELKMMDANLSAGEVARCAALAERARREAVRSSPRETERSGRHPV